MHLADEFYLIAHQDSTGKARLHPKAAGHGTAAALLAELYLPGNVTVDEHKVTVTSSVPPGDPLAHNVLERLLGDPEKRAVRDWLALLGHTAVRDVAQRLTRQGILEMVETRRPWGVKRSHVPVAINEAAWPRARITARLITGTGGMNQSGEEISLPDRILIGLCHATGLARQMLWDEEQQAARGFLAQVIGDLPPPMRKLVTETQIALRKRSDVLA